MTKNNDIKEIKASWQTSDGPSPVKAKFKGPVEEDSYTSVGLDGYLYITGQVPLFLLDDIDKKGGRIERFGVGKRVEGEWVNI